MRNLTGRHLRPYSDARRVPVEYKGVRYESYTHAGRVFGLSPPVVKLRLAKGQPLEARNLNASRGQWQ